MRRTKEESEQTRIDILNAAIEIFCEKTVAKATLDEIARAANVTRGAIYWHFKNKLDIFDALFENLHVPFITRVNDELSAPHDNALHHLRDICIELMIALASDKHQRQSLRLFFINSDYSGDLSIFKDSYNIKKQETRAAFAAYFKKAQDAGHCSRDNDPDLLAQSFSCYLRGILSEYLDSEDDFDIVIMAPNLMNLYFKNLS